MYECRVCLGGIPGVGSLVFVGPARAFFVVGMLPMGEGTGLGWAGLGWAGLCERSVAYLLFAYYSV